jgi:hypothetical protein
MRVPGKICLRRGAQFYLLPLICIFVLQGLFYSIVWAKAVSSDTAHNLVKRWLEKEAEPMGSRPGSEVADVKTFKDSNNQPAYYVVNLKPGGFVVVSADDLVEPVVCFSASGSYDFSAGNPLVVLVGRDIPARIHESRSVHERLRAGHSPSDLTKQQARVHKSGEKAFGKWTELLSSANAPLMSAAHKSGISDIRVSPLLATKWGQDVVCGNDCYNYYTPNNYPCGCVATAVAQCMRYWEYPTNGVGTGGFTITVGCVNCYQTAYLRGGNGSGGPYNWSQMPYTPDCSTTYAQRQAIGALTYDAGVASKMDYEYDGSGAYLIDAAAAMVDTFGYSNAVYGFKYQYDDSVSFNKMVNPNLDSGSPVILGILGDGGSHAVVADGYGYQNSTMYHHLNMGWNGSDDVWYNLPNIDAPAASFDTIDDLIYNIYINGTGEIISGRVTEADSRTPISDATVTAVRNSGGETYQAVTNIKGIYALANVPSNSTYTISVSKAGHTFADRVASTGESKEQAEASGNCWAIDFVPNVTVSKCTVSAGSNNNDSVFLSGALDVTYNDISTAGEILVDISSTDMANEQSFPVNLTTFKNGKFNCTIANKPMKASFALNTKTAKFSFTAKNIDLSGLSCPLTVRIEIGDYDAVADVNEAIANGKKPVPINLLMGIKNSLRVDKSKFTRNKITDNITQLVISGGFAVKDINDANLVTNDFNINIDSQIFTVPAGKFKFSKGKFTCSKVDTSKGIAAATFDFNRCTFTMTIKNTNLEADAGPADFKMEFGDFSEGADISLP